jgi:DNA recombination protein RmuC
MNALVERLGRLDEATRNVQRVGESIVGLEQLLASPKLRGGFGEWSLESLLADVLPASSIVAQHRLPSRGTIVDFAVRTGDGRIVPIDSKFPVESYRRLIEAQLLGEVSLEPLRREMHRTLRARVGEIAQRYICPDDGTLDFALMYVPSEGVYYEVAVRDEGQELLDYARERQVLLCSPNTLYAYLQAIMAGLRGVEIARHAREIHAALEHLRQDVTSVRAHFERAGAQLRHASQNLDMGGDVLERIYERVTDALSVEGPPALSVSSAPTPAPESAVSVLRT